MVQVPNHEQHYPDKTLPTRLEEYVLDSGPPTQNRLYAKKVTGQQVLDAVIAAQQSLGMTNIDPRYFVGTCFHESGCTNEWDTEIASPSNPLGFVSVGAFQISQEECEHYGFQLIDMLDLTKATACMVKLAEFNRNRIRRAASIANGDPDPDYTDANGKLWVGGTMRAYLAICHNHGGGYVGLTIERYGLDWDRFKARNPTDNIVAHQYGVDCITGGPMYPDGQAAPVLGHRLLYLTTPFMEGPDVADLQRHLKIDPDGVYGPDTEKAVEAFQKTHGLTPDGKVGGATWPLLLAA